MISRAASVKMMKSGKSFSQERQDPLKKSLPPKHPYYVVTLVSSKVVLYRARRCLSSLDGQVHLERDTSLKAVAECLITRRHFRKPATLAISSCDFAVKLFVKDAVSASKPI